MTSEEWRPIAGFPDYQVSRDGRVRSAARIVYIGHKYETPKLLPARELKQARNRDGHMRVQLFADRKARSKSVHRLVAAAFVSGTGDLVRHRNGDPADNRAENLEWGSAADNAKDAVRLGELRRGESHPMAKLSLEDVDAIRVFVAAGLRQTFVAKCFGVAQGTVNRIWLRKGWQPHSRSLI